MKNRVCYDFDDIISCTKINFSNILLAKKYENISVYDILRKTQKGLKSLHNSVHKMDRFIKVLDEKIKHLVLFDYGLLEKVCDKIKYLIS